MSRRGQRSGPAHGKAAHGKSTQGKPAHGKPAHGKPAHGKTAHGKAARAKPVHGKHAAAPRRPDPRDARSQPSANPRAPRRDHPAHDPRSRAQHGAHPGGPQLKPEPTLPPDVQRRLATADQLVASPKPPRAGQWLWTSREGAERDVIEELLLSGDLRPQLVAPSLVASERAPGNPAERLDLTFARQGFPISRVIAGQNTQQLAAAALEALVPQLTAAGVYGFHVFVPDSTQANPLAQRAQALSDTIADGLLLALPGARRLLDSELRRESAPLAQVCLYGHEHAAVGVSRSDLALSNAPGGRTRMRLDGAAPSRAARKLEEAFAWLGVSPGPGELCVDLGAAPGGWSWLLLERRARVIAVDPARMDPKLAVQRRLQHVQGSAFDYAPDEPVDWLFCDMAWRPLEVAQMLARWARRRFTRLLVSNFKLPMKRKAETVERIRATLADGGFTAIHTRQLYHDREEITLTARVG